MSESAAATLDVIGGSRRDILDVLKKRGEASADELASELRMTVSGVRQQLAALGGDGLVTHRRVKGGPGRPRHLFLLSPAAESFFPKTYSELTNELLGYIEDEEPEMVERIFEKRRRRRLERARLRLDGLTFDKRVAELTRILDDDGYLADVEVMADGAFRIVEHNCAILGVAQKYGQACSSEIGFIREALPDAEVERVAHKMAGAHVCAYEIRPRLPKRRRPRRS